MVCVWHIIPLLLATVVLADYYIDNANTSVVYSMTPSQSGQAWQTFSVVTQSLALSITNSTGNYTIILDASHCYDENYALGVCGSSDNCFVQMPFTGSGITMYVYNAGFSGMTASFSVDGGAAVSNTIQGPPAPTYQVSNVSLYSIHGLLSGNHTMKMTILDWNGAATSMKFDYAYVNETFVAPPATTTTTSSTTSSTTSTSISTTTIQVISQATSQTPTQTSAGNASTSNKVNLGSVIGGTLGGVAIIASVVIGVFYFRKRKASRREEIDPFRSEHLSSPTAPPAPYTSQRPFLAQHAEASPSVSPLQRSAILRDALAASSYPEPIQSVQSISSGWSSPALQPLRRQASHNADADLPGNSSVSHVADTSSPVLQPLRRQASHNADADLPGNPSVSHVVDPGSPFSDPHITSRYSLTTEQFEVINQLRADKVPAETIARVVEGFVSSRVPVSSRSFVSALPPPSYKTQAR